MSVKNCARLITQTLWAKEETTMVFNSGIRLVAIFWISFGTFFRGPTTKGLFQRKLMIRKLSQNLHLAPKVGLISLANKSACHLFFLEKLTNMLQIEYIWDGRGFPWAKRAKCLDFPRSLPSGKPSE